MASNKNNKGQDRVAYNLPRAWDAIVIKLAKKRQQPKTWTLLALVAAEAQKQGIEHPPLPWDESEQE